MASRYISRLPSKIPAGKKLVHNRIRATSPDQTPNSDGFRAWMVDETDTDVVLRVCNCGWSGLEHYTPDIGGAAPAMADEPTVGSFVAEQIFETCRKLVPMLSCGSYTLIHKSEGYSLLKLKRGKKRMEARFETLELELCYQLPDGQLIEERFGYDNPETERKVAEVIGKCFNLYFPTYWMAPAEQTGKKPKKAKRK